MDEPTEEQWRTERNKAAEVNEKIVAWSEKNEWVIDWANVYHENGVLRLGFEGQPTAAELRELADILEGK